MLTLSRVARLAVPYRRESREGQLVEGDCVRRREGGNLEPGAGGQYGVDEERLRWGSRTLHCEGIYGIRVFSLYQN